MAKSKEPAPIRRDFGGHKMKCYIAEGDLDMSPSECAATAKNSLDMAVAAAEECQLGWVVHHVMTAGALYGNANPNTSICNCPDAVKTKRHYAHLIKEQLKNCDHFVTDPEPRKRHKK
jgi:hypothetical protein